MVFKRFFLSYSKVKITFIASQGIFRQNTNWASSQTGHNMKGQPCMSNSTKAQGLTKTGRVTQNKNREGQAGSKTKPRDDVKSLGFPPSKLQNITAKVSEQARKVRNWKGKGTVSKCCALLWCKIHQPHPSPIQKTTKHKSWTLCVTVHYCPVFLMWV